MKKKLMLLMVLCSVLSTALAQNSIGKESMPMKNKQIVEYEAKIFTNNELSEEIGKEIGKYAEVSDRSLFGAAALSTASTIVSSVFDWGMQQLISLVTRRARIKKEWETQVGKENTFEMPIKTISEMKDFYSSVSYKDALDPTDMIFDGIGCVCKKANDTAFYVSFHIDRSKIDKIVQHGKFELVLDTLIVSPIHSNLPNSTFDTCFSYEDRKDYKLSINLSITSSWFDLNPQLNRDILLGEFRVDIPVNKQDLIEGYLRYTRNGGEPKYKVVGESFIVPRSCICDNKGKKIYGTGEYNLSINIKETCSITEKYRENWRKNYSMRRKVERKRQKAEHKEGKAPSRFGEYVTKQWTENGTTIIKQVLTPFTNAAKSEMLEIMNLPATSTNPTNGMSGGANMGSNKGLNQ